MRLLILLFSWLSLHCTLQMTVFVFQSRSFLKLSRTLYSEILYKIISIKQLCSVIESLLPPQSSVVRLHLLDYWILIQVLLEFFVPLTLFYFTTSQSEIFCFVPFCPTIS